MAESDDWLNSWTTTRKLPQTFRSALRYAYRREPRLDQSPEGNRIARPKMTWQETRAYLAQCAERASLVPAKSVPTEYADEKQQAAFNAVYRNRSHMLRVPSSQEPRQ